MKPTETRTEVAKCLNQINQLQSEISAREIQITLLDRKIKSYQLACNHPNVKVGHKCTFCQGFKIQ